MRRTPRNPGPPGTDKIKQLYLEKEDSRTSVEYSPFFYVEAKIDFNDVRTGFRSTVSLSKALQIYLITSDMIWADDMIQDVDPQKLTTIAPDAARHCRLPDFIDAGFISQMETQFIQYLLRTYKARIYRNFELDVYSIAGESQTEFAARCLDLLDGSERRELDALQDVFKRKLEQIKQKYLGSSASDNLELAKLDSQSRDIFSSYSERIAELFLQPERGLITSATGLFLPQKNLELEERLLSLVLEAQQVIAKLWDSNREKARAVDEYILHPNLKDIHFVRSCILWIPSKAA
jgi:hypothetical protein